MLINIHECSISVMYGATIDQSTVQIQKVICIVGHMTSISANEITMTNTLCPHKDSIWFWSNSAYIHSKPFNFTFLKSICILPGKSVSNYTHRSEPVCYQLLDWSVATSLNVVFLQKAITVLWTWLVNKLIIFSCDCCTDDNNHFFFTTKCYVHTAGVSTFV